ncbi:hypothetical protein VDGL01_12131 [Verticillium dahliae]
MLRNRPRPRPDKPPPSSSTSCDSLAFPRLPYHDDAARFDTPSFCTFLIEQRGSSSWPRLCQITPGTIDPNAAGNDPELTRPNSMKPKLRLEPLTEQIVSRLVQQTHQAGPRPGQRC